MRSDEIKFSLCLPLAFVLLIAVMHANVGFQLRTDAMNRSYSGR